MRRFALCTLCIGLLVVAGGCSKKSYKMPSGSMWPGIEVGAHVTADSSIKTPARGDVFVFKYPEHPEQAFVKRIVGLPGDRIETKGQVLSVNGKPLASCAIGPVSWKAEEATHDGELVLEAPGYVVFYEKSALTIDGSWTVPEGQFWVMGDNRYNSHDSRMWNGGNGGGVPQSLLLGKVEGPKAVLPKAADALAPNLAKCKKELGLGP